jgi:hypothetical protein
MSFTTSLTEPAPSSVKLRCARIVVWNDGRPSHVDPADLPSECIERAAATAQPIWVQLLLPWLSEDQQAWFEGSVDPWQELEEPGLDWTDVRGVLDAVGIGSSALDPYERRLLERLPLTDTLYQLDRQLERLLRRVELNASDVVGQAGSSDIAVRYRFALDELRSLEGNGRLASEAIRTAEQAEREHFEFVAAIIASVILVPTLVATIYGANVKLPARDSWAGFAALVGCIIACVVLALLFVRKALPREAGHGAPVFGGIRDRLARVNARRDGSRRRDDRGDTPSAGAARA